MQVQLYNKSLPSLVCAHLPRIVPYFHIAETCYTSIWVNVTHCVISIVKLPYDTVIQSVGWLDGQSVGWPVCRSVWHKFLQGREVSLPVPCCYRCTYVCWHGWQHPYSRLPGTCWACSRLALPADRASGQSDQLRTTKHPVNPVIHHRAGQATPTRVLWTPKPTPSPPPKKCIYVYVNTYLYTKFIEIETLSIYLQICSLRERETK